MNRCPIHPAFFKSDSTRCPACEEAFNADIESAAKVPLPPFDDWKLVLALINQNRKLRSELAAERAMTKWIYVAACVLVLVLTLLLK